MSKVKKISTIITLTLLLSFGLASVTSAANCTSWETYDTGSSYCTTEWCNPINPFSGDEELIYEYQSRICNVGGGNYEIEYRTILTRESCDC